jgi:hypothetical protein
MLQRPQQGGHADAAIPVKWEQLILKHAKNSLAKLPEAS